MIKNIKLIHRFNQVSSWLNLLVFLIGLIVLMGWILDIHWLKIIIPNGLTMKANTAICFILSSLALGNYQSQNKCNNNLSLLISIFLISISGITIIQYILHSDYGIDQILFKDLEYSNYPGRMSFNTSLNFILVGIATFNLNKKSYKTAQSLGIFIFWLSLIGFEGYIYGISSLYTMDQSIGMAIHTAIAFILASLAILFAKPDRGLMRVFVSDLAGGIMIRRLAIAIIIIPMLLSGLIILGQRANWYSNEIALVISSILYTLFLGGLIWYHAHSLTLVDHQALYDSLTELPNRHFLNHYLLQALNIARRTQTILAVMFLDIDRFKMINDGFGHLTGDQIIKLVTERLIKCISSNQMLIRWGGDEFIIIMPQISDIKETEVLANHILTAFQKPFRINQHHLYIRISIGSSFYPYYGHDAQILIQNADMAMCLAKQLGGNQYKTYDLNLNSEATRLIFMENYLRGAWERGEIELHYQPKYNITGNNINGLEVLARWFSPELGSISPNEFIPLAEQTGLINELSRWVLKTACIQYKKWLDQGLICGRVAVNLSPRQFLEPNLVKIVSDILQETQLNPKYVELEITESTAMENIQHSQKIIKELSELGIKISMDDFGTGYSSLGYLKKFSFSKLKIDKSLIQDITSNECDRAIAKAIITIAKELNMIVIAEGVETEEQLQYLASMNCDEIQGYLFSRPLSSVELTKFLNSYQVTQFQLSNYHQINILTTYFPIKKNKK